MNQELLEAINNVLSVYDQAYIDEYGDVYIIPMKVLDELGVIVSNIKEEAAINKICLDFSDSAKKLLKSSYSVMTMDEDGHYDTVNVVDEGHLDDLSTFVNKLVDFKYTEPQIEKLVIDPTELTGLDLVIYPEDIKYCNPDDVESGFCNVHSNLIDNITAIVEIIGKYTKNDLNVVV
jgi:hypothetical protein